MWLGKQGFWGQAVSKKQGQFWGPWGWAGGLDGTDWGGWEGLGWGQDRGNKMGAESGLEGQAGD